MNDFQPTKITIEMEKGEDYWDASVLVGLRYDRTRGATALRAIAMGLYSCGAICQAHYDAIMETACHGEQEKHA